MLPTNNSYYRLPLIPTIRAITVHRSETIDGGREERPPPPKRDRGGICRAVVRSPVAAVLAPHLWGPPTLPPPSSLFLPSTLSLIHPAFVPPGLNLCPPHPCQESRKPPCCPPLLLPPTATTTPPTSAASKPRGTHRRTTSGRGPSSPRHCCPGTTSAWSSLFWWVVSVILISCLLVRLARRSLSACPHFFVLVVAFGIGQKWREGSRVVVVLCSVCW